MRDAWADLFLGGRCVVCDRAGRPLCPGCEEPLPRTGLPVAPDPCPPGLVPAFAAGEYDGPLRALVLAHKERAAFSLARPLGRVLGGVLTSAIAATRPPGRVLLVPVPSRPAVVRARGHDPMHRVTLRAAAACRGQGLGLGVLRALRQRRRASDQAGLDSGARAENLRDTLAMVPSARSALVRTGGPVGVVVCDDVLTTGATAREAQRAMEDSGVRVLAIACLAATRKRTGAPLPFSGATG